MEICYKRNLNQSYMFMTSDPAYSGYQIHMCRQNHIHNLLQFEPVVSEGRHSFDMKLPENVLWTMFWRVVILP